MKLTLALELHDIMGNALGIRKYKTLFVRSLETVFLIMPEKDSKAFAMTLIAFVQAKKVVLKHH